MGRKKKTELPYNNLEVVTNAKEHFISLCTQHENMTKLFAIQDKVVKHPQFSRTTLPANQERLIQQHQEMSEELKNIGALFDLMPGKKVMKKEEETKKIKKKEEVKEEGQTVNDCQTFVSNIAPPEEKEEK